MSGRVLFYTRTDRTHSYRSVRLVRFRHHVDLRLEQMSMTTKMRFIISSEIRLSGASSQLIDDLRGQFTIQNPAFIEARKRGRWTGHLEADLRFYHQDGSDIIFPRGTARDVITLARQHGPAEIVDSRLSLPEIGLHFSGSLRPYQQQAISGILSKDLGVLEAGTGSGKTVMALSIIAARRQPALVLVHTKELLYQWQDRARQFLGIETGLLGDGHLNVQPVTIGIVNSVRSNLEKLTLLFGHLVIDECHRVPSSLFTETASAFPAKYALGLSATPFRRDGLDPLIGWFIGAHKVSVDATVLREVGAVLRPTIITRETGFNFRYQDNYQEMLSALVANQDRNRMIATDIRKQAEGDGLSLVVSDRVDHLKVLAELADIGHEILTGKTPKKKRQEIVEDLRNGKIRTLYSTLSLIGEGFDCPSMDSLFLASPIKFSGRLTQTVGRVLRPAEGKVPTVFDYQDNGVGILKHQAKARQKIYQTM